MSGHRDDGTFAEDKAHHPRRKVDELRIDADTRRSMDEMYNRLRDMGYPHEAAWNHTWDQHIDNTGFDIRSRPAGGGR